MSMVRFGNVAERVNTKEDRFNTTLTYYVGGDHIETNELRVTGRGVIKEADLGPMFYFGFKPGDILFVTRNPHLRKSAKVDFSGICSEKTLVIATKDEKVLLQAYLVGVMQSDDFWDYMEENKSGSVNYFINWSTLADYEFDLPPLARQKELAELLWAANDLKEKYQRMIAASDEMLKAKFREMFGSSAECRVRRAECEKPRNNICEDLRESAVGTEGARNEPQINADCRRSEDESHAGPQRCKYVSFKDCYTKVLGGKTPSMVRDDFYGGNVPFVKSGDIKGDYVERGSLWLSDLALREGGSKYVPAGSVIVVVRSATLKNELRVAIARNKLVINQDLKAFVPKENYDSQFLMRAVRLHAPELLAQVKTMLTSHIDIADLDKISIPQATLSEQQQFVAIARAADETKAALKKSIADVEQVMKGLIN